MHNSANAARPIFAPVYDCFLAFLHNSATSPAFVRTSYPELRLIQLDHHKKLSAVAHSGQKAPAVRTNVIPIVPILREEWNSLSKASGWLLREINSIQYHIPIAFICEPCSPTHDGHSLAHHSLRVGTRDWEICQGTAGKGRVQRNGVDQGQGAALWKVIATRNKQCLKLWKKKWARYHNLTAPISSLPNVQRKL